jgi:hypothetical protein
MYLVKNRNTLLLYWVHLTNTRSPANGYINEILEKLVNPGIPLICFPDIPSMLAKAFLCFRIPVSKPRQRKIASSYLDGVQL